MRARFCFKVSPTDPSRRDFEAHFIPADALVRADGRVRVRRLLDAWWRVRSPTPYDLCGGLLFWSTVGPWGFAEDQADFLPVTLDYVSYAGLWFEAAAEMGECASGERTLHIHGAHLLLTWRDGAGTLRCVHPSELAPLEFESLRFVSAVREASSFYQQVRGELLRQLDYAWNDPPRRPHVGAMRAGLPSYEGQHGRLLALP
ncbi:MAG: hypothetical protein R3B40_11565 [Polyangiales bacterium]